MRLTRTALAISLAATAIFAAAMPMDDDKPQGVAKKEDAKPRRAEAAKVGDAAPEFTLTGADGKTYNLSDYKGHTVVLEWFSPSCPVSGHGDRSFWGSGNAAKTVAAVKAADPDAVYLTINSNHDGLGGQSTKQQGDASAEVIAKGGLAAGLSVPVLMDPEGKVGRAYGAKTTPHMFVINTTGTLVYVGAPASDDGKTDYITSAVTAIKAGKPVEPANTKNSGCGIKYAGGSGPRRGGGPGAKPN